jgi:tRNA nucleotidyltransferase (CCA-adding enzyme)
MIKREHSCGAIVLHQGKFLLVKTSEGFWYLPKGHIDKGETEEECAIREVKEETGLSIIIIPGFKESITYFTVPKVQKTVTFFLARTKDFTVRLDGKELIGHALLPPSEAIQKASHDNTREVLQKAERYIREQGISD